MKHLLPLLLLIMLFTSCSKETQLQNAIDYIGQADAFMGPAVGIIGTKPDVYKSYEQVLKLANHDQLFELINDDRAAVRIYGFQGMVETNHPETFLAFKELVTDSSSITTMRGCIMSSGRINVLATNLLTSNGLRQEHYQLKGQERIVFDSLILFSEHSSLALWTMALETVAPVDEHYQIVKQIAYDSTSISAQIGLANFQREEDIDFFRRGFSMNAEYRYRQTMDIISRFPHPSYLPFLKEFHSKLLKTSTLAYDLDQLYIAIFQYPIESIEPFIMAINAHVDEGSKREHQQSAWIAAQLNGHISRQELVKAVALEEYQSKNLERLKGLAKYSNLD
ncbi:MAG: hypothetical protein AB8H12_14900 [Lewinella sp.]